MGDRFYNQQLKKLGTCPGHIGKRKRNMAWTDEKKAEVVAAYENAEPTAETSMEIVKDLAEEFEESPNGVRMILSKAGVYVKKNPSAVAKASNGGGGGTRVSKAEAQQTLIDAISDAGQAIDEDIISKLTGKASLYLAEVISASTK